MSPKFGAAADCGQRQGWVRRVGDRGTETFRPLARSRYMMLLIFSLIAASPILGVSLWLIDESYGDKLAPRLRARANAVSDRWLKRRLP
jgi:hypothetical protein